jgi:hypothetical protein
MKMFELNESELSTGSGGHGHHRKHGREHEGREGGGGGLGGLLGGLSLTGPVTQVNESVIVQIMLGGGVQNALVGQGNTAA